MISDALINYKGHYYTGTDIKAMRDWLNECEWPDISTNDIMTLTPTQVLIGVIRHFEGGLPAFLNNIN